MLEEEIKPLHVTGQHCWIILSTLSHQEHQIHSEAKWQEGTVHWAALIRQWIRALLLIGLLCNQRGNLVFLLLLLLQQPAREKGDSTAGIPTVQGPRSNQTPSRHIRECSYNMKVCSKVLELGLLNACNRHIVTFTWNYRMFCFLSVSGCF